MAEEQTTDKATDQNGQAGAAAAEPKNTESAPGPVPYERFKAVNTELAELKRWRAEQEKASQQAAQQAEAAEAERLAKQQEWQKLAEKRAAEVEALKPVQERATRYETALKALLETQRQGLPGHVVELLDKLDPVDQLEYIAKHQAELARPAPPNTNAAAPNAQRPPEDAEAKAQELRQRFRITI